MPVPVGAEAQREKSRQLDEHPHDHAHHGHGIVPTAQATHDAAAHDIETAPAAHTTHPSHDHTAPGHDKHAGHTPAMFRHRFWLSRLLTLPILYFDAHFQGWFGYQAVQFLGMAWVQPLLSTVLYLYGGGVFVRGAMREAAFLTGESRPVQRRGCSQRGKHAHIGGKLLALTQTKPWEISTAQGDIFIDTTVTGSEHIPMPRCHSSTSALLWSVGAILLLLSPAIGCLIHPDDHKHGERHAPLCSDASSPVVQAEERSPAFADRGRSVLWSGTFLSEGSHIPLDNYLRLAHGSFLSEMNSDSAPGLPLVTLRL